MTLKGFLRPCAISSASERCAELGRSYPSDGEPASSPHAKLTQSVTLRSLRPKGTASFVAQAILLVGGALHVQRFPEGIANCDDHLDEGSPTQRNSRWQR